MSLLFECFECFVVHYASRRKLVAQGSFAEMGGFWYTLAVITRMMLLCPTSRSSRLLS